MDVIFLFAVLYLGSALLGWFGCPFVLAGLFAVALCFCIMLTAVSLPELVHIIRHPVQSWTAKGPTGTAITLAGYLVEHGIALYMIGAFAGDYFLERAAVMPLEKIVVLGIFLFAIYWARGKREQ